MGLPQPSISAAERAWQFRGAFDAHLADLRGITKWGDIAIRASARQAPRPLPADANAEASKLARSQASTCRTSLALPDGANAEASKLALVVDGSKEESDVAYKARLSKAQYAVLRQRRTEPRHIVKRANGGFDDVFDAGDYYCQACGDLLYTSDMKYDCGCGWPGFWTNVDGAARSLPDGDGRRNELVCNACNSHLGHVFFGEENGYPTDERHCVNSCSLAFAPEGTCVARACKYKGKVY